MEEQTQEATIQVTSLPKKQYARIQIRQHDEHQQEVMDEWFTPQRILSGFGWFIKSSRRGFTDYECQIDGDDYVKLHNLTLAGHIEKYTVWCR